MIPLGLAIPLAAVAFSAVVAGVAYVQVAKARSETADARAELSSVKAAIANEREVFVQAAREKEAAQEAALAAQAAKYFNERMKREAQHMLDIARVRDGFRLRDPGASAVTPACASANPAAGAGSDGPARGELSESASAFLLSLANEADAVVEQLGACQQYALSVQSLGASNVPANP